MSKNKLLKIFTMITVMGLISVSFIASPASALISQNTTSWYWTSDTNVSVVASGDVNGDGQKEIVTGGWFNDGNYWNAQLQVWNASNLSVEKVVSWHWISDTQISSIAIGDVNGDGKMEIVTGGSFFDGTRWNAQLIVWNGTTLNVINSITWYWTSDTEISSVAVGNITGGIGLDIITGAAFFDGTRWNAQLTTWNGNTLAVEKVVSWYWTSNTYINSVAVGNVSGSNTLDVVTGGTFNDGIRDNAQLLLWDGATLAVKQFVSWYWTSDTQISSVAIANITGGASLSIVTGGSFNDGTRTNAQLMTWSNTLAVQNLISWFTTSNTIINSIAVTNYTGGSSLDIISAGTFNDGSRNNAQLIDFNGSTFAINSATSWFITSDTSANSIAIGNFGLGDRIVVGSSYFDSVRSNAQITIFT